MKDNPSFEEEIVLGKQTVVAGGRVGLVVRALALRPCGPGSISARGIKCGLSLMVRGFSSGTLSPKTNI